MASIGKFSLTLPQAKAICKKQNLEEPAQIKRFEKGMINDVFLLNNKYVIKINTGHPKLPKLKKEKELYKLLKKNNIPVPKVYSYDSSKSIIDYSYIIMEKIEGNSLNDIWDSMKKDVKLEQLSQMGEVLARIHSITFDNFGEEFSKGKFKGQKTYKEFIKQYTNSLANELEKSNVLNRNKINSIKDYFQKSKAFNINPKASLLHGNFNYDNILVKNKKIKGIVDWEWGRSRHNEEEVSIFIYHVLKEEKDLVREFKKGYEKILKLGKSFEERYKAYNLLYYLRVLPSVPALTHRPDKQKEYYDEVNKLYSEVIDKKND